MGSQKIVIKNSTGFFNREKMLYSVGFRFRAPITLTQAIVVVILFLVWTVPLTYIFGFRGGFWYLVFVVAPPIGIGTLASKPIWGNRGLVAFILDVFDFIRQPRTWLDTYADADVDSSFKSNNFIWISRRKEYEEIKSLYREQRAKNGKDR